MPDTVVTEEALQFGEGGRLLGILTQARVPSGNARELPVFVFLNAGSLDRVGPSRLHVRLARELASMGFSSLRVDLAGTGDSSRRPGLTNQQSVAADYLEIVGVLNSRLGSVPLVLAGLCSGADNAIRLTLKEGRVVGLVLLDPICFPDDGFRAREIVRKYTNPARYVAWGKLRIKALTNPSADREELFDYLELRDLPTRQQMREAFESIRQQQGRVLSVFTNYATLYYNQVGQMGRVLEVESYQQFCTELFWPGAEHTYPLELYRRCLIEEIKTWANAYIRP